MGVFNQAIHHIPRQNYYHTQFETGLEATSQLGTSSLTWWRSPNRNAPKHLFVMAQHHKQMTIPMIQCLGAIYTTTSLWLLIPCVCSSLIEIVFTNSSMACYLQCLFILLPYLRRTMNATFFCSLSYFLPFHHPPFFSSLPSSSGWHLDVRLLLSV